MLTATKHGLGRLSSAGVSEQYLLQFADPVSAKSFEKAFNEAKVSCEAQNVVDNCSFFTTEGLAYRGSKDFSAAVAEDCAPWVTVVRGTPEAQDWLNVGGRYLPRALDGKVVLKRYKPDDAAAHIDDLQGKVRNALVFPKGVGQRRLLLAAYR
jgi:hypothetical protein